MIKQASTEQLQRFMSFVDSGLFRAGCSAIIGISVKPQTMGKMKRIHIAARKNRNDDVEVV